MGSKVVPGSAGNVEGGTNRPHGYPHEHFICRSIVLGWLRVAIQRLLRHQRQREAASHQRYPTLCGREGVADVRHHKGDPLASWIAGIPN